MWAAGCVLGELLLHRPLLPGKTELDQVLNKIFLQYYLGKAIVHNRPYNNTCILSCQLLALCKFGLKASEAITESSSAKHEL